MGARYAQVAASAMPAIGGIPVLLVDPERDERYPRVCWSTAPLQWKKLPSGSLLRVTQGRARGNRAGRDSALGGGCAPEDSIHADRARPGRREEQEQAAEQHRGVAMVLARPEAM